MNLNSKELFDIISDQFDEDGSIYYQQNYQKQKTNRDEGRIGCNLTKGIYLESAHEIVARLLPDARRIRINNLPVASVNYFYEISFVYHNTACAVINYLPISELFKAIHRGYFQNINSPIVKFNQEIAVELLSFGKPYFFNKTDAKRKLAKYNLSTIIKWYEDLLSARR